MPTKPTKDIIDAAKVKMNPKDVMRVVIQETPELRDAAIAAGVVKKVDD
mgnify:CR=1 FL=1